jgi:hypothetical protein
MISEKLNGVDVLTFEKWVSLLHVLCPKRREEEVKLLWEVLDCENNNYISKHLLVCNFLRLGGSIFIHLPFTYLIITLTLLSFPISERFTLPAFISSHS